MAPERVSCLGLPDQRAAYGLAPLAERLAERFDALAAGVVLTHAYEGGHPDHDATAFAVHVATRLLRLAGRPGPDLVELTGYHLRDGRLEIGTFLPNSGGAERCVILSPEARALKRRMLGCFRTQAETLAQFGVEQERFRRAPRYRFTEPPHPGPRFYDPYPWGLHSAQWSDLAAAAARRLGLRPEVPL